MVKLTLDDKNAYVNGKLVFSLPGKMRGLTCGVVMPPRSSPGIQRMILGSACCCHGYLYYLEYSEVNQDSKWELYDVVKLDTNAFDILPVIETGDNPNEWQSVLIIGNGCAGNGIRHIGGYHNTVTTTILGERFGAGEPTWWQKEIGGHFLATSQFRVDEEKQTINIDFFRVFFLNPNTPKMRSVRSKSPFKTIDITSTLDCGHVDITKTVTLVRSCANAGGMRTDD